ncbi:MAG TPA: hypothetical protein VFB33_14435 [Candidatus Binataceae bacterium]|nr:hypothetical protein [Candidatus Binataceae bacterium]
MKQTFALLAAAVLALGAAAAAAQTPPSQGASAAAAPAAVAHRGQLTGQPEALFSRLEADLSGGKFGPFTIISVDVPTRTIVARRSNIDSASWARWAFCRMGPLDLLDVLRDGSVTLTVRLEPTTKWITWAVVKADFNGTYAIGAEVKQTQCISTGVLEEDILHRLGADVS